MAQHRTLAVGECGGNPATALANLGAPDYVDAPVNDMQSPRADAGIDRPPSQAKVEQLPATHDAVLTGGQGGEQPLGAGPGLALLGQWSHRALGQLLAGGWLSLTMYFNVKLNGFPELPPQANGAGGTGR